ncbi:hypothetical protein EUZ85_21620 [Hahella sp. KA22]|uniref:AHH domain-containing protein n=1 Tax=Hahella sp. KA22 TaxID=1628392 RepID=UPI000FDF4B5C|nr:AHH domain-containing protein [Hahella sp. KA22]AZZ93179.1 hypothetical protein ENC22_19040 [Hahella sp. KA22]QAY56552.1 hypothetical protein EUZ85_21620 [Hahella sp. KA22]
MSKKQKSEGPHECYTDGYGPHKTVQGMEGGSCLARHEQSYKKNNSCSYRWQGVEKAKTKPGCDAYNAHPNTKYHITGRGTGPVATSNLSNYTSDGSGYDGVAGESFTSKKGDAFTLVQVNNFTTGFAPYGNQVHHIVNISSVRNGIEEIAKDLPDLRTLIVNGLLDEKYNINHKDNSLILPTQRGASAKTGLPSHYGSHPKYSKGILKHVLKALKPYKSIANQMKKKKKEHDAPNPVELKEKLEKASNTIYQEIIAQSAANRELKKATKINDVSPCSLLSS